jgi:hypothetical protein
MTKPGDVIRVKDGDPMPVWIETPLTDRLRRPFDPKWINRVDKGSHSEDYVNHAVVTNRLNEVLGVEGWSFRIVEVSTFGDGQATHVAHVLGEMTVGDVVRQEIGVPSRLSKYHDEIKTAVSDAVKRCAMRYGVAIQLWHDVETSGPGGTPVPETLPPSGPDATPPPGLEGDPGGTSEAAGGNRDVGKAPEPSVAYDVKVAWQELYDLTAGDKAAARRAVTRANKRTSAVTAQNESEVTEAEIRAAVAMLGGESQ